MLYLQHQLHADPRTLGNRTFHSILPVCFRDEPEEAGVQDGVHQRHEQRVAGSEDWPGGHHAAGATGQLSASAF